LDGPGDLFAYLTGTFGQTEVYFDSSDGFDPANGYRDDTITLPAGAHTHLSWAFTQPGVYRLTVQARLQVEPTARPQAVGATVFTFAVGTAPPPGVVLDQGHADLTANLDQGRLELLYDPSGGGEATQVAYRAADAVVHVPAKALAEVPAGGQHSF
jgi:surface-anchored protein